MFKRIGQSRNKYFYLLVVVFLLAELIILPFDNFPLNDDWVYAKTLRDYFLGRKFNLETSNCTLWTQIMWGNLFAKIFGFSFGTLRLSTLVSSIIGVGFLYKLVFKITSNEKVAFISAFIILFNPFYFSLSHTYMTDVNFSALLIICLFLAYQFFQTKKLIYMFFLMVCALLLILIRQFGVIVPLCFTLACFFIKEKKWKYVISAVVLSLLVFWGFKYYEHFIRIHKRGDYYPFSSNFSLTDAAFWKMLWVNFKFRYAHLVLQTAVYIFPVLLFVFVYLLKNIKPWVVAAVLLTSAGLTFWLFDSVAFPLGNIFVNTNLGADTFYEWMNPEIRTAQGHTYSPVSETLFYWVKIISVIVFLATCLLAFIHLRNRRVSLLPVFKAEYVFLLGLIFTYTFLLMVSETFFDRYAIPMFVLAIVLVAYFTRQIKPQLSLAWLFLLPFFYVSVFGTKDYFEVNRLRWKAYNYLRFEKRIPNAKINAGYEVDCWNDGAYQVFYKGTFVYDVDYLIEYTQVPEFKVMREYEFQRYLPFRKDKIFIFVREQKTE